MIISSPISVIQCRIFKLTLIISSRQAFEWHTIFNVLTIRIEFLFFLFRATLTLGRTKSIAFFSWNLFTEPWNSLSFYCLVSLPLQDSFWCNCSFVFVKQKLYFILSGWQFLSVYVSQVTVHIILIWFKLCLLF